MTQSAVAGERLMIYGSMLEAAASGTGREVEMTIIKAGFGNPAHRHFYGADVLKESVDKFVGVKMFANHEVDPAAQRRRGGVRDVKDLVGVIREAWWDETAQAVKGKATILRDWVMEVVGVDPTVLDVSINALGKSKPGRISGSPANIVEAIHVAKSVDLVSHGGAGGKLDKILESLQEEAIMALESLTLDDIKEHRSDLLEAYASELQESSGAGNEAPAPEDMISKDEHETALQEAATSAAAKAVEETEARIKAEHALELQKRDNALVINEMLESDETRELIPQKSRESIRAKFDGVTFEGTKDDDGNEVTPEGMLREALQSAIKEKQEELAEALGSGKVTGMGSGNEGSAATKRTLPKHASVLAQVAPDVKSDNDN